MHDSKNQIVWKEPMKALKSQTCKPMKGPVSFLSLWQGPKISPGHAQGSYGSKSHETCQGYFYWRPPSHSYLFIDDSFRPSSLCKLPFMITFNQPSQKTPHSIMDLATNLGPFPHRRLLENCAPATIFACTNKGEQTRYIQFIYIYIYAYVCACM